jgi:hypothetical protein
LLPLQPFQFGAFEGKRRSASFGFRYDTGKSIRSLQAPTFWLQMKRSKLFFADAVLGSIDDASETTLHVFGGCLCVVQRQPLFACFRSRCVDHIAGEGGCLLDLLASDLSGLCFNRLLASPR